MLPCSRLLTSTHDNFFLHIITRGVLTRNTHIPLVRVVHVNITINVISCLFTGIRTAITACSFYANTTTSSSTKKVSRINCDVAIFIGAEWMNE